MDPKTKLPSVHQSESALQLVFLDVRTNNILKINVEVKDSQFEFVIMTDEIETAADII